VQHFRSSAGYDETLKRLLAAIDQRGLTVFAQFDHAAGAREVGLELRNELVVVFGNPKAGTLLMQADPLIGIEFPLRMLIWEDAEGVNLGYNDPRDLARQYAVGQQAGMLETMSALLNDLAQEAGAQRR
jgi:uncharacterized protein (DUF302 family)